jgi:CheY-like chemotaxis protein/HPt (histidine-containing phosphotransfer) domain-containing protein
MVRIDFNKLRFLVIDDNAHMRRILRTLLHGFGARDVYEAEDGAAGLEAFTHYMPDIVLTDWAMPIFDGLELAQMIRQPGANANPYVPIIMLTGHSEKKRVVSARDAGITEFMAKPISAKALYQRILNVVANPRPFIKTKTYFGPAPQRQRQLCRARAPQGRQGRRPAPDPAARQGQDRRLRPVRERPMSQARKDEKPSVATYADYEIITPPNRLRRAVAAVAPDEPHDDPVARAEQALATLAGEFSSWMDTECQRLDRARQQMKARGLNKTTREALFLAAHDIKGEASTFGFPWIATLADSLCRLIEHTPDMSRIPFSLVDQHVDAVRAIFRESARPDVATLADALGQKLREVTDEFLAHENRDRPDYLDGIVAPPLAPGE